VLLVQTVEEAGDKWRQARAPSGAENIKFVGCDRPAILKMFSNVQKRHRSSPRRRQINMVKRKVGALEKVDADLPNLQYKVRRDPAYVTTESKTPPTTLTRRQIIQG
jgi:hypothetical protein